MKTTIMEILGQHFRPDSINRADESVVFKPLSRKNIRMIAGIQVSLLVRRFADRQLELVVADAAIDLIGEAVP